MRTRKSSLLQTILKQGGLAFSCWAVVGTCLPGAKSRSWGYSGWPVVWKASGVCILAPMCPVSLLQVDSWALGVLLYTLIYGTMPFDGFDHKNLIRQISSGEYREPTQPSGVCLVEVRGRGDSTWFTCPSSHTRSWFIRHLLLFPILLSY